MGRFDNVLRDPDYLKLKQEEQVLIWDGLFKKHVLQDPDFVAMNDAEKQEAYKQFVMKYMNRTPMPQPKTTREYDDLGVPVPNALATVDVSQPSGRWDSDTAKDWLDQTWSRNEKQKQQRSPEVSFDLIKESQGLYNTLGSSLVTKQYEQDRNAELDALQRRIKYEATEKKIAKQENELAELLDKDDLQPDEAARVRFLQDRIPFDRDLLKLYETGQTERERQAAEKARVMMEKYPALSYPVALGLGAAGLLTSPYTMFNPDSKLSRDMEGFMSGMQSGGSTVGNIVRGVIYSAPMTAAIVINPLVGTALTQTMMTSDVINDYFKDGSLNQKEAWTAAISGAVQGLIEYGTTQSQVKLIQNAWKKGGQAATTAMVNEQIKEIIKPTWKQLGKSLAATGWEEAIEEVSQNVSDKLIRNAINGDALPDMKSWAKELTLDFVGGLLGGVVFGGIGSGVNMRMNRNTITAIDKYKDISPAISTLSEAITAINQGNFDQATKLYNAAKLQMGNIDIDANGEKINPNPSQNKALMRGFSLVGDAINLNMHRIMIEKEMATQQESQDVPGHDNQVTEDAAPVVPETEILTQDVNETVQEDAAPVVPEETETPDTTQNEALARQSYQNTPYKELQAKAKELGINPFGVKKSDLIAQIEAKESGTAPGTSTALQDVTPKAVTADSANIAPTEPQADIKESLTTETQAEPEQKADVIPDKPTTPQKGNVVKPATSRIVKNHLLDNPGLPSVDVQYEIMDADDVIASNTEEFAVNPAYPKEKQPRDSRNSETMQLQTEERARTLIPEVYGDSTLVQTGAPVVGANNEVDAGNGRAMALKRMWKHHKETAAGYKQWLLDNAERLGLDPEAIRKMNKPVLVKRRVTELSKEQEISLASGSNIETTDKYTPVEQAVSDAKAIGETDIALNFNNDGTVNWNSDPVFIRSFLEKVIPKSQWNSMAPDNNPTAALITRIVNALIIRAYGDNQHSRFLVNTINDSSSPVAKNIITAMMLIAPRISQVKQEISREELYPLDISDSLMKSAARYVRAVMNKEPIDVLIDQQEIAVEDELDEMDRQLLRRMLKHNQSPKQLVDEINKYYEYVEKFGSPQQVNLFDSGPVISTYDLYKIVALEKDIDKLNNDLADQYKKVEKLKDRADDFTLTDKERAAVEAKLREEQAKLREMETTLQQNKTEIAAIRSKQSFVREDAIIKGIEKRIAKDTKAVEKALTAMLPKDAVKSVVSTKDTIIVNFSDGRQVSVNLLQNLMRVRWQGQDRTATGRMTPGRTVDGKLTAVLDIVASHNYGNTTLYHEGFHLAYYMFLNDEQRAYLQGYYKNKAIKKGYTQDKVNDAEFLEELMADEFADYAFKTEKADSNMITRIWDKLKERIRNFMVSLGVVDGRVKNIFKGVKSGAYDGNQVGLESGVKNKLVPENFYKSKQEIVNPIDPLLSDQEKVLQLETLRNEAKPEFRGLLNLISDKLGLKTNDHFKDNDAAIDKTHRSDKPDWYSLEHLGDYYRGMVTLNKQRQIVDIIKMIDDSGMGVVEFDYQKLITPTNFGYRDMNFILRMPNGLMVEFQAISQNIADGKRKYHKYYDRWRSFSEEQIIAMGKWEEYLADEKLSFDGYSMAWSSDLSREGMTHEELIKSLMKDFTTFGLVTRANSSFSISTVNLQPLIQAPSSSLVKQALAQDNEALSPLRSSDSLSSDNFISTSTDNIMQNSGDANKSQAKSLEFSEYRDQVPRYKMLEDRNLVPEQAEIQESERQMAKVRAKYESTDQWMKAPNGKPTNLNEYQWLQVRTENFLNWFGDWINDPKNASKVVDENGEPLVVYHGSPHSGFSEFSKKLLGFNTKAPSAKKAFFFAATPLTTDQYNRPTLDDIFNDRPQLLTQLISKLEDTVRSLYYAHIDRYHYKPERFNNKRTGLDMKRKSPDFSSIGRYILNANSPTDAINNIIDDYLLSDYYIRDEEIERYNSTALTNNYHEFNITRKQINDLADNFTVTSRESAGLYPVFLNIRYMYWEHGTVARRRSFSNVVKYAKEHGQDGGVITSVKDGADLDDIYYAFSPKQIKSAIGNVGTFSNENPDIRYSFLDEKLDELSRKYDQSLSMVRKFNGGTEELARELAAQKGLDEKQMLVKFGRIFRSADREAGEHLSEMYKAIGISTANKWIDTNKPYEKDDLTFHLDQAKEFAAQMGLSQEDYDILGVDGYTYYINSLNVYSHMNSLASKVHELQQKVINIDLIDSAKEQQELLMAYNVALDELETAMIKYNKMKSNAGRLLRHARENKTSEMKNLAQAALSIGKFDAAQLAELNRLNEEIAKREAILAEYNRKIDELNGSKADLEEYEAQRQVMQKKLDELQAKLNEANQVIDKLRAEYEKLNQEKLELSRKIKELQAKIGQLQNQLVTLKNRVEDIKAELDALRMDKARIMEEIKGLDKKLESVKAKIDKAKDPQDLIRKLKPNLWDIIKTIYYGHMLSGPTTHIKNMMSTSMNMIVEQLVMDVLQPGNFMESRKRALGSVKQAASKAREAYMLASTSKYDIDLQKSENKLIKMYSYVFKALVAEDAFLTEIMRASKTSSLAYTMAKGDRNKYNALVENPTPEMLRQIEIESKRAAFNNQPEGVFVGTLYGAIQAIQHTLDIHAPVAGMALRGIIPFIRVPANVFQSAINWTPLGYLHAAGWKIFPKLISQQQGGDYFNLMHSKNKVGLDAGGWARTVSVTKTDPETGKQYQEKFIDELNPFAAREAAMQFTKATIGSVLMALLFALAKGIVTGGGPRDPEKRSQLMKTGWQEYSIRMGGKWVSYRDWFPLALTLSIVGNYYDYVEYNGRENESLADRTGFAIMGVSRMIMDRSFLQGLSELISAMEYQDGNYPQRWLSRTTATMFTPNILKQIEGWIWGREQFKPETMTEQMIIQLKPYTRMQSIMNSVPRRIDMFGEDQKRPGGLWAALGVPVNEQTKYMVGGVNLVEIVKKSTDRGLYFPVPKSATVTIDGDRIKLKGKDMEMYKRWHGKYFSMLLSERFEGTMNLLDVQTDEAILDYYSALSRTARELAEREIILSGIQENY